MPSLKGWCMPPYEKAKEKIKEMFKDFAESPGAAKYIADLVNSW